MNEKRRMLAIAALSAIVLLGVFPPWTHTFKYQSADSKRPAGYAFILTPPPSKVDAPVHGVVLDVTRLLVQWTIVLGLSGIGWLLLRE